MLTDLIHRFLLLPGAAVPMLPGDAGSSRLKVDTDLATLLERYPFIRRYPDYIDFLRSFGGASLQWPAQIDWEAPDFHLFLIHELENGLLDADVAGVDDGYFNIGTLAFRQPDSNKPADDDMIVINYLINADESGPHEVYGRYLRSHRKLPDGHPQVLCDTFTSFLNLVVATGARVLPASDSITSPSS